MIPVYAPKFRRAPLSAVMAVAIFAVPTTSVFAQTRASTTITLNPSKDNTLIENGSGSLSITYSVPDSASTPSLTSTPTRTPAPTPPPSTDSNAHTGAGA